MIAILWILLWLPPLAVAAPAIVAAVQAPAWQAQAGSRAPLRAGAELAGDERLVTGHGGRIVLRFAEGSDVKFGENSDLRLGGLHAATAANPFTGVLNVLKGAFRFTTSVLGQGLRRNIQATVGTATIGIRGTDVWGKAAPARDFVVLIEGHIEITRNGALVEMATPNTVFNADRGAAASPIVPVDAESLGRWAAETEPEDGHGVMRAGSPWCLQVASFRGLGSAERLRSALAEAGYAAELVAVVIAGRPWQRVQLRNFASRADAQAVGAQLQRINSALTPRAVLNNPQSAR